MKTFTATPTTCRCVLGSGRRTFRCGRLYLVGYTLHPINSVEVVEDKSSSSKILDDNFEVLGLGLGLEACVRDSITSFDACPFVEHVSGAINVKFSNAGYYLCYLLQ